MSRVERVRDRSQWWGVALYRPKYQSNVGTIVRTAYNFGAHAIFTIGDDRYVRQSADTVNATRWIPLIRLKSLECLRWAIGSKLVFVEMDGDKELATYKHYPGSVYVFGSEDGSLPHVSWSDRVKITTDRCLNLSVAAGIVMYDRMVKEVLR